MNEQFSAIAAQFVAAPGVNADACDWFVAQGSERSGPHSLRDLVLRSLNGEFNAQAQVWCAGMAQWAMAEQVMQTAQVLAFAGPRAAALLARVPRWHVAPAGGEQVIGPLTQDELAQRLVQRTLDGKSLVWCQGMQQWQPIEQVQELAALLSLATPHMSPPPLPALPGMPPAPGAPAMAMAASPIRMPAAAPALQPEQNALSAKETIIALAGASLERASARAHRRVFPSRRINAERLSKMDEFFAQLRNSASLAPEALARLSTLQSMMEQDFMSGNAHGLDAQFRVLNALITSLQQPPSGGATQQG